MHRANRMPLLAALALSIVAAAPAQSQPSAETLPARTGPQSGTIPPGHVPGKHMSLSGYLTQEALPDSALILPPPPAPGSRAQERDEEAAASAVAQQGSARWTLATADAELMAPDAIGAFSCAAGFGLGMDATPAIARLLRKAAADIARSTFGAKKKYMRSRPFMENGKPTCTPDMDNLLRQDGSYPSGHSALGYGQALVLAELIPSRATQLGARGLAFGDSRRICNVHWLSDIEQGRVIASITLARLHADPAFQRDLAEAHAEADRMIASQAPTGRDCMAESAALSSAR